MPRWLLVFIFAGGLVLAALLIGRQVIEGREREARGSWDFVPPRGLVDKPIPDKVSARSLGDAESLEQVLADMLQLTNLRGERVTWRRVTPEDREEPRAVEQALEQILVAKSALPAGTVLDHFMLETIRVPGSMVTENTVPPAQASDFVGRKLRVRLTKGDPMLRSLVE